MVKYNIIFYLLYHLQNHTQDDLDFHVRFENNMYLTLHSLEFLFEIQLAHSNPYNMYRWNHYVLQLYNLVALHQLLDLSQYILTQLNLNLF